MKRFLGILLSVTVLIITLVINPAEVCATGHDEPPIGPTPCSTVKSEPVKFEIVDHDTYKSEFPSRTAIAADSLGSNLLGDFKIHSVETKTEVNQKLLVQALVGANAQTFITENIYPRRDLSITENGSLQTLTWNNLPKNQAGAISAVVYNQIDGAYVIHGILDANGTAVFTGFKLRPASTITICK